MVIYEAIRKWCRKFGQSYANELRRRRPRPGDKWHLDGVFLTMKGECHYLWRHGSGRERTRYPGAEPAGQEGCKEILPQAAQGLPVRSRVIITDKPDSYGAAKREMLPGVNTANIDISTTARRTPTNPPASGSGACRGSSRQGTPNASSPRLVRSPTTFDRDGIACRLQPTGKSCGRFDTWQELTTPPQLCIKSQTKGRSTPSCPRIMLIGNKLAMPKEGAMTIAGDCVFGIHRWSTKSARCFEVLEE